MNLFQSFLFSIVSFLASTIGAICGIGGGVIIKPVLDSFGWISVNSISFLSGCTVLSMSCYSVGKAFLAKENKVQFEIGTPLAIGAALGGVVGKYLFNILRSAFEDQSVVGAVQSICLLLITIGTLLYTIRKDNIRTYNISCKLPCICIGTALGITSSFLSIGGGPINLVVLYFFFSMDTKTAAANSLYIILFSQIASLLSTIISCTVPTFAITTLCLMGLGGIVGGIAGRQINKRIDETLVEKLFIGCICSIICISIYNVWKYLGS